MICAIRVKATETLVATFDRFVFPPHYALHALLYRFFSAHPFLRIKIFSCFCSHYLGLHSACMFSMQKCIVKNRLVNVIGGFIVFVKKCFFPLYNLKLSCIEKYKRATFYIKCKIRLFFSSTLYFFFQFVHPSFLLNVPAIHLLKGTVSRDFLLLVLFMNQFPPSPRVFQ